MRKDLTHPGQHQIDYKKLIAIARLLRLWCWKFLFKTWWGYYLITQMSVLTHGLSASHKSIAYISLYGAVPPPHIATLIWSTLSWKNKVWKIWVLGKKKKNPLDKFIVYIRRYRWQFASVSLCFCFCCCCFHVVRCVSKYIWTRKVNTVVYTCS